MPATGFVPPPVAGDEHRHRCLDQVGTGDRQDRCEASRSYGLDSSGEYAVVCGAAADFFCEECGSVCEFCARSCAGSDHKLSEIGDEFQNGAEAEIGSVGKVDPVAKIGSVVEVGPVANIRAEAAIGPVAKIGPEAKRVVASQGGIASFNSLRSEIGVDSGILSPEVLDAVGTGGLR